MHGYMQLSLKQTVILTNIATDLLFGAVLNASHVETFIISLINIAQYLMV